MQIQGFWQVFLVGAFGGFLVELLRWYRFQEAATLPDYASRRTYWVLTGLMILSGGLLAVLYGLGPVNAMTVANIGASAPALIGALAVSPRQQSPGGSNRKEEDLPMAGRKDEIHPDDDPAAARVPKATGGPTIRRFLGFRG